jgi:poly(A) polymerase
MIKKFIKRLFGSGVEAPVEPPPAPEPVAPVMPLGVRTEFSQAEHGIDPRLLDDNAVRVVRTLKEAGHEAYIVGGAVRDLLVGLRPKDFDVATDATPEQVKALFRRAFIIGRRFRLVHVVFGRGREHETIEVSTFRAYFDSAAAEQVQGNEKTAKGALAATAARHVVDASGRVLRDNVWGPQIEDAARRDFTINAMYFEPLSQTLVDYHGGMADARARVLRMIGDPPARYREDPVRIVRLLRFAAKLGFDIEPGTAAPIATMAVKLSDVPASRLFDEMVKLLQTGHAVRSVEVLRAQGMIGRGLFPVLDAALAPARASREREEFVQRALANTDARVEDGRSVVPSFLLACLLWHDVQDRALALREQGEAPFPALQQAVDEAFERRIGDISGRGKLAADMREIWFMQPRFERRTPAGAQGLAAQPRFRAGFDFLRLRADVGELPVEMADWWEDYHLGSDEERQAMLDELRARQQGGRVRRVPKSAVAATAEPRPAVSAVSAGEAGSASDAENESEPTADASGPEGADPARKRRRRRRRRPGGRSEGSGEGGEGGGDGGGGGEGGAGPGPAEPDAR